MIVDGHQHVLKDVDYQKNYNIKCGVNRVILFPTSVHPEIANNRTEFIQEFSTLLKILKGEINPIEARINSIRELIEAINFDPDYFIGFASCPFGLDIEKTGEWIEEIIIKNNFKGIGELTFGAGNVSNIENIFKYVHENKKKLPLWIHTFNPLAFSDINEIVELAKKYNSTNVILGHGGGYNWLETLELVKDYKNIYMDISASFNTFSIKYISQELPDRCLYSSDLPYGDPFLGIKQIDYLINDKAIKDNILGLNTKKLLGI